MLTQTMLFFSLLSALLLSGGEAQAPGDGNSACPQTYPDTWRVLMDSWRYKDLLDDNNAAWEERSVDGDSFTWTPGVNGICRRDFRSCDYTVGTQNNWVFTQHISKDIPAEQPSNFPVKVYVNITYSPVGCVTRDGCIRRFDVYNYLVNTPQTRGIQRDTSRYSLLQGIRTAGRQDVTIVLNFDLPQNQNGFYLAFRDPNTCVSIERVIVYRKRCPEFQDGLVSYSETPSPLEQTQTNASCVSNASPIHGSLAVTCSSEGKWVEITQCQCNAGYRSTGSACPACPAGTYRRLQDPPTACISCPANTDTSEKHAEFCCCLPGFFRTSNETVSEDCTSPPSAAKNPIITETTNTTATLSWERPTEIGRDDFYYMIFHSDPDRGGFDKQGDMLVDPNPVVTFTVTGLQPATSYTFKIVTANGVSDMDPAGSPLRIAETDVATTEEGVPGPPVGVLGFCSVVVWQKPDQPNGDITGFDVLFARESGDNSREPLSTPKTKLYHRVESSDIPEGSGNVLFQVRARTSIGAGTWSSLQDISCTTLPTNEPLAIVPPPPSTSRPGKVGNVTEVGDVVVWDRPSSTGGEITGYELRFYLNGGASNARVIRVTDPNRQWFHPTLSQIPWSEVPVFYQVRAINSAGDSEWSDETTFCDLEPCLTTSRHVDPNQPCPDDIPPCNFDTCRNLPHKFCVVDKTGCGGSCQVSSCRVCTAGEEFTTYGCDRSRCKDEYDQQCITDWGKCVKRANKDIFVRPKAAESSMNCVPHSCLGTSTGTTPTIETTPTSATTPAPTSFSSSCPSDIPRCDFDTCQNIPHQICVIDETGCGGSCQVSSCRVCTAGEEFTADGCDRSQCKDEYDQQCITDWGTCIKKVNRRNLNIFLHPTTSSTNCVPHPCL